MFQYTLYDTIPPPIPPRKQFKINRPNAAPCGILFEEMPRHYVEYFSKQVTIGNKSRKHNRHHDASLVTHMAPTPSITTIQQIGIGIAHAYSRSLILNATQNFKISNNMPGVYIFNFLLPHDQVDNIPNLDVDVN